MRKKKHVKLFKNKKKERKKNYDPNKALVSNQSSTRNKNKQIFPTLETNVILLSKKKESNKIKLALLFCRFFSDKDLRNSCTTVNRNPD